MREGIRDINCDKKLLVNNCTVPVFQQFLFVPLDIKMKLAKIMCSLQISLRFLVDASLNTGFCSYIGGKLDTKVTSVRQKQVRGV